MKKILVTMAGLLLIVACGGGGGGLPSLDDVEEGAGPALDISKSGEIEQQIESLLQQIDSVFGEALSLGITDAMGSTIDDDAQSEVYKKICEEGYFSLTLDTTIIESHYLGKAAFSGKMDSKKVSNDQINSTLSLSGDFSGYGFYLYSAGGEKIYATGDIQYEIEGSTKGADEMCEALPSNKPSYEGIDVVVHTSRHMAGALSVSGDIGAAIAFDITSSIAFSSQSEDGPFDVDASGTIAIKSGGEETLCSISLPSIEDDYKVDCD